MYLVGIYSKNEVLFCLIKDGWVLKFEVEHAPRLESGVSQRLLDTLLLLLGPFRRS
jgi:hypothetical protein